MRRGMTYSTILHLTVILVAFLGIPHLMRSPVEIEEPIPVEVVTVAPKTNVPKVEAKPVEQPTPPKKVETPPAPPLPAPPNPAPQKSEVPPPPQPTPPAPEPLVAALPPQPPPQPKPAKAPEPVETSTPLVPTPPKAKPTPPPQVTVESILKSVEKAKPRTEPDKAEKVIKELAQAPKPATSSLDNTITASEISAIVAAVKSQMARCWNIPAGAKDAKNLVVEIHLALNPDGTVREATVVDQARLQSDGFFRTAAESARRAILLCQPLKLPSDKYSVWQEMTLSFNPSQIL